MIAPTPGRFIVGINAETGEEVWRYKPRGRPAFRGLIYWPGTNSASGRVLFCAGQFLYALNPKTGEPITDFGDQGHVALPGVAPSDFGTATAALKRSSKISS